MAIVALLGLEDVLTEGKLAGAFNSIKEVVVGAAAVIKWFYTNVIRPVISTMITGLSASIKDLADGKPFRRLV